MKEPQNDQDPVVCYCNSVRLSALTKSIADGARTLPQIYDQTGAGTGPCGGSCKNKLIALLRASADQSLSPTKTEQAFSIPTELVEAVSLFNRRYYWETHEVLEHVWMDESGPRKLFLQGLIQAAAALYHVLGANPKGCIKLAHDAAEKLSKFAPTQEGIPLIGLIESLQLYELQSKEILGGHRAGFDYDRLPVLNLAQDST